ncbi:MAG: hypothetical protein HC835_16130 [Oscillatoriales cyanobacterium RM2_1_1]|nr:hypothetical protein [Oscillatoriales cyanobacterium SM2_3_0]NJO47019.1 hypothetical protein [Oscillatoriales cyanobacterium RM2_1_1]
MSREKPPFGDQYFDRSIDPNLLENETPSLEEWIQEHRLLADAVQVLRDLQTPEMNCKLGIDDQLQDQLRSHYNDEHWQQIKRYLGKN